MAIQQDQQPGSPVMVSPDRGGAAQQPPPQSEAIVQMRNWALEVERTMPKVYGSRTMYM